MPPRQDAKATLSRSRTNRVTHKTRLRVLVGRHDVEPIIDDDEAVDYHTHGVEAHESTEIHLQRSLSVTTLRALGGNVAGPSSSGAGREKGSRKQQQQQSQQQHSAPSADAIPIPDASGIIDDTKLYPHGKFKETAIYIKFSDTVEESIASGLAANYTYYIDERDKAWLDKNNQAARGEGSSSQAARAAATASGGQPKRNGKAKEPEAANASSKSVEMSEDEFELVMGLFERRAADPPFVFSPDSFPAMEVYDEWFQTPLAAELFAAYSVPSGVPEPGRLLELAQAVYPHWKERRSERAYHHVMPQLSLDESMTNDSYACFRRRELRPVRRTRRQADAGVADPMLQLRKELNTCLDIAKLVAKREVQKRQQVLDTHAVADARLELAHLKRAHPVLGDRTDELLLFDKEPRPRKRKPTVSLSINTLPQKRTENIRIKNDTTERNSPATVVDRCTIAQQRIEDIAAAVERDLSRLKQEDAGYEDGLDFPYQKPQIPAPQRLFKGPIGTGRLLASANRSQSPYAVRLRTGRGGRIVMDRTARRPSELSPISSASSLTSTSTSSKRSAADAFDSDDDADYEARMRERWQYDSDPLDTDPDANRVLVDDFSPALMRHRAMVTSSTDLQLYFNTSESHRFHDYRHSSMSGAPATSPSTHFSPGVRGSSTRRRGSMTRSGTMPPPRFIPGPSSGAVVGPGSGVPSHPATPTTPAPPSAGGAGAPPVPTSATAQSSTIAVKQESQVSAASIVGRDPPSSPSPAGGVAAGSSSAAAAAATLVTGRRNGVAVPPPLIPPLPPLSQPASTQTVGRPPAIKAGELTDSTSSLDTGGPSNADAGRTTGVISSPGGTALPAKGRLRLSDDGAPVKAPAGAVGAGGAGSPGSTQPNGHARSRSKAAETLPVNGKGHGAGPPLQNRSNGHGPPKTNGNAATAPAVNGNGNGATLNGHHHHAHSKSRSPSTESARGATAASEAASAMSIDSES